jgi:hypothetical protein
MKLSRQPNVKSKLIFSSDLSICLLDPGQLLHIKLAEHSIKIKLFSREI